MKYPVTFKVFRLKDSRYYADDQSVEDYMIEQLQEGYITIDMRNFDIDYLRIYCVYEPERARDEIENIKAGGPSPLKKVHNAEKV